MKAPFLLSIASALFMAACGGETGGPAPDGGLLNACPPILPLSSDPDPRSGPADCTALDDFDVSLMDDFETGAATGWYINNDRTALQKPAPDTDPVFGEEIPGGRCIGIKGKESRFAIHIVTGVMTDYGGVFGRNLPRRDLHLSPDVCPIHACLDRVPYPPAIGPCGIGMGNAAQPPAQLGCLTGTDVSDASNLFGPGRGAEGIVIWARKGAGSASTIRVHVGDEHTDDSNQACECNNSLTNPSGQLVSITNQNDSSNGCDKFGMFRTLDSTFRPYLFPFDEMQQGGWGKPSPTIDRSGLFSIGVDYGRGGWDLWIDDIGFYRRKQ